MNILDLVREKGIEPKRASMHKGGEYHSSCPECGGEDRFHIWPDQNNGEGSYWCRQCGKVGDAIQFLRDFDGMGFRQACERLDKIISQSLRHSTLQIPRKAESEYHNQIPEITVPPDLWIPDLWIEKATKLITWAHDKLLPNSARMKYLRERGIRRRTVIQWRLGWNPGNNGKDLWRPRESWGLITELKNGQKKRLWIPRGLIIPLLIDDQIHRIRIRTLSGKPSYYILPGSSMRSLCIGSRTHRAYVVVESELDAILLNQEIDDIIGIVALGSAATKPDRDTYQSLRQAAIILVALDFDAAGAKSWHWWKHHFPQAERWPVPRGKDPGEAFQAGINLSEWIRSGLPKGWHIGQSLLGSKEREAGEEVKKSEVEHGEAVKELMSILKVHPVGIQITSDRIRIQETRKWVRENWEVSKRLSELVFLNEEVMDFLHTHPEQIIIGNNINKNE